MTKTERIMDALREHGELTPVEIANILGSKYHGHSIRSREYLTQIYRLCDRGLIERVPNTKPIKWRLKE